MSDRKLRWLGLGLAATAGAGVLGLTATTSSAPAHADGEDIGLVIGGSGTPIPGADYVAAADGLYLDNPVTKLYPDLTFYQATPTNPFGEGLYTPEGLYPLTGVHTLEFNYPPAADGFPSESTSVGQGDTILANTVAADTSAGDTSTVFGYSQSSTIASYAMQQLDPNGTPQPDSGLQFLLVGDPSAPNGGLLERFAGFETTSGQTVSDPLNLPSLGVSFDSATPADDYVTNIYTLEYDGFADFPRYPIDFLSDLNAFLGIETIHGTYLNGGVDGSGPTAAEIASATLLPGSAADGATDSLTNYYMIDETAPLVSLLPKQLQELLGPDLTYLINLGYGDGSLGYSVTADSPANVDTPFGLFPDVSLSSMLSTLTTDTEQGFQDLMSGTDPFSAADPATSSAASFTDLMSALSADAANPAATLTDFVNALSTAASAAYSTLLPTADIINALVTSIPAYDASLISDNLSSGNLLDAFGLPIAANAALDTLAAGFEYSVLESAATQITDAFSGLF
ncbi:PE-PPE domain-containing protein [Candidatus Mycobacterium methanotrophicum]|uniref:PE-PPE domain-containing protein n=1 Tax=Candidatus Mycobacterium methanotrophicum TaxID=2943498 RepID=A0ABY4QLS9_9MYCO|nr:PE-PPE domain-containing protein [Candidatus Mycobacterium methanotrophicum]UQX10905.1 PE-PPE domain-containing protein [Candidatus Mycobacterium methanotrophicum]